MEASAEMELERIRWAVNRLPKSEDPWLDVMSLDRVDKARAFHRSFPQYSVIRSFLSSYVFRIRP